MVNTNKHQRHGREAQRGDGSCQVLPEDSHDYRQIEEIKVVRIHCLQAGHCPSKHEKHVTERAPAVRPI